MKLDIKMSKTSALVTVVTVSILCKTIVKVAKRKR